MTTPTAYYLSVEEALELHRMLIERFGGSHGVRDFGLVESAVHRPQSGYYETLSAQAAALLQSFAMNHAFIDGNRRVAFASAAVFLSVNGFGLKVEPDEGEDFVARQVVQMKLDVGAIAGWLEARMRAKPRGPAKDPAESPKSLSRRPHVRRRATSNRTRRPR